MHLKMLLLLLLALLLPATTVLADEVEGSGNDIDDEDLVVSQGTMLDYVPDIDKATGATEGSDNFTVIVIAVAVAVVALAVVVIVAIHLVRRHTHRRQQGVYSVPTDQDQKVSI